MAAAGRGTRAAASTSRPAIRFIGVVLPTGSGDDSTLDPNGATPSGELFPIDTPVGRNYVAPARLPSRRRHRMSSCFTGGRLRPLALSVALTLLTLSVEVAAAGSAPVEVDK